MRVFKRVYCTLVQKQVITISKVPDMVSLPLVQYIPTFDYIYILTQGGPAYSSEVLATHLYSQAFDRFNVGYSSAIGTLMFIYVLIIVSIFGILQKMGWNI